MKKFISRFDFRPIAFVAAMGLLLSTMVLTTAQAANDVESKAPHVSAYP